MTASGRSVTNCTASSIFLAKRSHAESNIMGKTNDSSCFRSFPVTVPAHWSLYAIVAVFFTGCFKSLHEITQVQQCYRGAARSTSRFHLLFVGGAGVCHCDSNISPLSTQAQHHFRVKKTVYPSLETNYQVRTVKSHIVLITPALLPWHMLYCPGCLQESMGLPLPATSKQACQSISKVSTADTFVVSVQLVPLR